MPNRRDKFATGEVYHIYNRGVDKRQIFKDNHDRNRFCLLLKLCNGTKSFDLEEHFRYKKSFNEIYNIDVGHPLVTIHAWTQMPNHFHLILSEVMSGGISLFMKSFAGAYAKYFNHRYSRTGTLFESRFKSKQATSDTYAKYLFAYVSLNRIKLIASESTWREQGIKDVKKVRNFLDNDEHSSLFDYLYDESPRLFSSIISKDFYRNYFSNKKFVQREIFDWLKQEGSEDVLDFK